MHFGETPNVNGDLGDPWSPSPVSPQARASLNNRKETRRSSRLAKKRVAPKNGVKKKSKKSKKPKKSKKARSEKPLASSPTTTKALAGLPDDGENKKRIIVVFKKKAETKPVTPEPPRPIADPTTPVVRKPRIVIVNKEVVQDGKIFFNGKPVSPVPLPAYVACDHQSDTSSGTTTTDSSTKSNSCSFSSTGTERAPLIFTPPTVPESPTTPGDSSDERVVKTDEAVEVGKFSRSEGDRLLDLTKMVELAFMAKKFPEEAKEWGIGKARVVKGRRNKSVFDAEDRFTEEKTAKDANALFAADALCSMARGQ